jgi:K+-sensing histidine kinase KdpD
VVRETLNVFSKQELATIGEEVVHLAMMIARGNCSVILDNGLELCINSALQYANRNFSGADKRQLELGLALSTVVQERRKARIQAQSVRGTHNLVVAKVRHDVKYYVTLLEDYITEFKSGKDVQASNVLAAIEDIQGLFYQPSESKSVDEFVKDVRRAVDSAGRISQQSRCTLFIDESLPSGRILEFREYEHLQSGVFNIILNAFQHSDQNSDIEISIAEQDHYIVLEITNRKHNHNKSSLYHDVSFREKVVDFTSRGSGLAITRQLLQDNGADVVIVEGADTFTVTIKVLMCS